MILQCSTLKSDAIQKAVRRTLGYSGFLHSLPTEVGQRMSGWPFRSVCKLPGVSSVVHTRMFGVGHQNSPQLLPPFQMDLDLGSERDVHTGWDPSVKIIDLTL